MESKRLAEIFNSVGSDKASAHFYEKAYAEILNRPVNSLLEIGIANAVLEQSSIWAWSQIFPDADIYGIDIMPEKMVNSGKIITFLADQSSREDLGKIVKILGPSMDIIIDDGSHYFEHSSVSFDVLFEGLLAPTGIYVIEDIAKKDSIRNVAMFNQQTLPDWEKFLGERNLSFKTYDGKPGVDDDSLIITVEKQG